jgi:tetratricopeptide (TPR) repeat protein
LWSDLAFERWPKNAIRHYAVGFRIGELSLGEGFDAVRCLWRLGRFEEATRIFDRMLWLNPSDNQGVRFLLDAVRAKATWENSRVQ